MSMETLLHGLALLWEKLQLLAGRVWDVPQLVMAWIEGRASTMDKVVVAVIVVLLVSAVVWIVQFFKAGLLRKLGMLLSVALVVAGASLILALTENTSLDVGSLELPSISLPPIQIEIQPGGRSGESTPRPEQPESTPESAPESLLPSGGQYSLARGAQDAVSGRVSPMWRLTDDAVVWQLGEDLVLQLSALRTLPGTERFAVEELTQPGDMAYVRLARTESSGDAENGRRSECVLEISVWPGARIKRMPWYAEAPSYISTGEGEGYSVFLNTGSEVQFLEKDASVTNENGDVVMALCLGRQIDGDVVLVKARAFTTVTEDGLSEAAELNPGMDEDCKRRLFELERALFDGRIRLLRDLSDRSLASLLPGRLCDAPLPSASGRGGFAIPCARLLEMRRSEGLGAVIRLVGPGPQGEELLYSLVSGAMLYENVRTDRYFTWREAYEKGWLEPDAEMTAFLGCPAVKADGGWVLCPGDYYSPSADAVMENYYFLSTELLSPAPTPVPTPEPTPEPTDEPGPEPG